MAERVTRVRLSAMVDQYNAAMASATESTRKTESAQQKLRREAQELGEQVKKVQDTYQSVGKVSLVTGAAITAGLGVAVKKASDFNQAMSNVKATGQDAADNFDELRDAAIDAGADTVFSATESANAIEEMAKAGVDAEDILGGGLTGALNLAAAGGLGVADAAGYAAVALNTFKLEGSDMSHVADLLAAGAGKAMGDVEDLGSALSQAGLVANSTGLSIEETTAALSAFASQGLIGSDAGTSFKSMLQRLTPQGKPARDMMEQLGISAYDASGNFIGLAEFADNLRDSMKDMTPEARNAALSVMFGSDAIRAANVLYDEGGDGIRDWISAVDDQGYAAEVAATRLDNLAGDVEAFGGSMDTALISIGDVLTGPLRGLVQWATSVVDGFNELPEPAKTAATWIGVTTAAIALFGGGALLAIPQVAKFRTAVETLGISMKTIKTAGAVGLGAIGLLVTALSLIPSMFHNAAFSAKDYADTLDDAGNKTAETAKLIDDTLAKKQKGGLFNLFETDSILEEADALGISLTKVRDAAMGNKQAQAELNAELESYGTINEVSEAKAAELGIGMGKLAGRADALYSALQDIYESTEEGTAERKLAIQSLEEEAAAEAEATREKKRAEAATEANERALDAMSGSAQDATVDLKGLADTIRDFGSAQLDVRSTTRDFEAAVDDLEEALEENGKTLDDTTEAGRANNAALDDLAKSAYNSAAAIVQATGDYDAARDVIQRGRDKFVEMAHAMGMSVDEAEALAEELYLIPENVETTYELKTLGEDEVRQKLQSIYDQFNGKTITYNVQSNGDVHVSSPGHGGGHFASGGLVDKDGIQRFAGGGFPAGIYAGQWGGIHKFSELDEGVPWEGYLSGRLADRASNRATWTDIGYRLGMFGHGDPGLAYGSGQGSTRNVNVTINNPVTRDPIQDIWDSADMGGVL